MLILCRCKKGGGAAPPADTTVTPKDTPIYKGADVSWVTQMEDSGFQFYNSAGAPMECMRLLQSLGINVIRLRVWVNPATRYNGTADVVAKAVRAKGLGMRVLIDFHYSDTWADPGHQATPAAWSGLAIPAMTDTLYSYTVAVLDSLQAAGVVPSFVQVGNEVDDGMCWPLGQASVNMANFAALVGSGYRAVKSINDSIQVIVHVSNGYDNSHFQWLFDGLKSYGAKWDIIGMSLYPSASNWPAYNMECETNMNDLVARYGTPVMICEVGMPENEAATCNAFITDLIHKVRAVQGGKGLGVFYWEPESYAPFLAYGLAAFDDTGKPTVAMDAFEN
ncbi:MAG TPA: glycosyl hydrolase 53 family protein [Puia sp.]|nr:glycosyl hydrolase 53 family protein [Puia sp.]